MSTSPLQIAKLLGSLKREDSSDGSSTFTAQKPGDGILYTFDAGALTGAKYLLADFILDGVEAGVFNITLQEGEGGRRFLFHFGLLNQIQARLRMPLSAVNQNTWMFSREGAWLKPIAGGSRVDLQKVDRMTLTLMRKGDHPVRWQMTPITPTASSNPEKLANPKLLKGPLLDALGQSTHRDWPDKTRSVDELNARLQKQLGEASSTRWPEAFNQWGGSAIATASPQPATRFFRTHHDGRRWWLIDPSGKPFWSAGMDCVRAEITGSFAGIENALTNPPPRQGEFAPAYSSGRSGSIDYLRVNLIRAFGEKWFDTWAQIALSFLRQTGFNTVANWSDWRIASKAKFPYVRPLEGRGLFRNTIYRDFPDVFDAAFAQACATYAQQLKETADDPALIGYFLMNEPNWGFSSETPAAGMLYNTETCATRTALAEHLRKLYMDDSTLSEAWQMRVTLSAIEKGRWKEPLSRMAERDLAEFSSVMVDKLFHTMTEACRAVDPNHLNLGARYHTVPPEWALKGMSGFDVFSINCYAERIPHGKLEEIEKKLNKPTLIGEYHFGALDVGLPASGIGRVLTQADRGKAFRIYAEDAAADPRCIGVHYFTLYDQSAIGRFDGENYNIGFLDVCNRPYQALCDAARASHERLYEVARGEVKPYADAPKYLPKLFF